MNNSTGPALFPEEISRVSFAIRYAAFLSTVFLAGWVVILVNDWGVISMQTLVPFVIFFIASIFYMVRYIALGRVRDAGLHGAFAFLILVPLVNLLFFLILLFAPRGTFAKQDV